MTVLPHPADIVRPATRRIGLPSARLLFGIALLIAVGYFIVPPLGMLLYGSITDTEPGDAPNFTLSVLREAYGRTTTYNSFVNSLIYAFFTSTGAVVIGGFLAWLVERTNAAPRSFAQIITIAPILLPAVVLSSAWVMLLSPNNGLINGLIGTVLPGRTVFNIYSFPGMIWVGCLQELPLGFLWLWPAFRSMNPALEEAAWMSGASTWTVVRRITIPLLTPTILAAWLICFIYGLGALAVPLLIGMPSGIVLFSTEIYLATSRVPSDLNLASAFCLTFLLFTVLGVAGYRRAIGDASRYRIVSGKAYAPRRLSLGRWRPVMFAFAVFVSLVIAGLPLVVMVWNAFMPFLQVPSFAGLQHFTLGNFAAALNYGPAKRAIVNSLMLGLGAGLATTALGLGVAWMLQRSPYARLAGFIDQLGTMPIAFPGVLVGISLLWTYLTLPIPVYGTLWILLIAYITLHLPYAIRMCSTALGQLDKELDEAAYISGASHFRIVVRIIFPLMLPSLLVSVLYVMLRAFREYSASIFLTGVGTEVFSVLVLDMWTGGNSNILAAYVTMVVIALSAVVAAVYWLAGRTGVRL